LGLGLSLTQVAVRGGNTRSVGPQILISNRFQDENTAIGTAIGTFTVVGGTGTYTLTKTADPDSAFTLTAGVLKNAIVFDYETATLHSVTIHADNGAGSTVDRTLTIGVNDIDEVPPVITSSATQSVNENSAFSLTLTADKAVTWTKTGGADTALFTLTSGVLTMTAKDFEIPTDANTDNVYVVQVTATSVAYAPATTNQTINVTVLDVAEGAPGTPTIVWTSDVTVTPPVFSFTAPTDPDLVVGDTVHFQRATDSGFTTSVTDYTNTVDSTEDAANALTFTSGTWANGTWYVRARTERVGWDNSAWSNTETKTLAAGSSYDAATTAWDNAVFADGGVHPTSTQLGRINTLILALKSAGLFASVSDRLWIYAGESSVSQAKIDLIGLNTHTIHGSPTLAAGGYTGDATAAYIDTGFNPTVGTNNYVRASATLGFGITSNRTTFQNWVAGGYFNVNDESRLIAYTTVAGGNTAYQVNDGTGISAYASSTTSRGSWIISRTAATTTTLYLAGASVATTAFADFALSNENVFALAANGGSGVAASFSGDQQWYTYIGGALNSTQAAALDAALAAYKTSWGF
jgi:hypothetical protein